MDNDRKRGFVYVLSNPMFPKWVKIGRAKDVDERIKTLNTGCPEDFVKEATLETNDMVASENAIHRHIRNLKNERYAKKEFFKISVEIAVNELLATATARGEIGGVVEYRSGTAYRKYAKDGKAIVEDTPVDERMTKAVFHTRKAGTDIHMVAVGKGVYRVLKGSHLDPMTESFPKTNPKDYKRRIAIEANSHAGQSARDEDFTSPSAAAATFLGRSANGRVDWVDGEGNPLGSYIPKGW